jgi:hypothetical protein
MHANGAEDGDSQGQLELLANEPSQSLRKLRDRTGRPEAESEK